jgi:2-polyprenyl-3-methyl-5-hydroxy-6-metoxy-1,4-benzoquinol methylase
VSAVPKVADPHPGDPAQAGAKRRVQPARRGLLPVKRRLRPLKRRLRPLLRRLRPLKRRLRPLLRRTKPARRLVRRTRRRVRRRLHLPPRWLWPFTLPGAPAYSEARWRLLIRRAPIVPAESHGAQAGVGEIEEVLHCTLCGESRVQPLFNPWAGKSGKRKAQRYHVVRCPSCGFLYRNPGVRPERLGDLYAGPYGKFLSGHYSDKRRRRYELVLDAHAPLFAAGDGRRLLDFGCGTGLFLDVAHERGFATYGVDLSADAVERARRKPSGAHVHFGDPMDVPEIAAGGFDVITLWSVLAHLPRPVEDLTRLRGLLNPDGVLLILTVNANSILLKAQGERWGAFTPNHVVWFAPATLERALAAAGFGAAVMRPMAPDSVATGSARMAPHFARRLDRAIARGNRGNMLRAVAFADPDAPRRWGMEDAVALSA